MVHTEYDVCYCYVCMCVFGGDTYSNDEVDHTKRRRS